MNKQTRLRSAGITLTTALVTTLTVGCQTQATKTELAAVGAPQDANKLLIVDCLLPGQVRKLGSAMTYLTPRRPIKTTAVDCEIRGGEYTAFDRADYRSALHIWLPQAKKGDADAQNYVGEIYEKGLGTIPDYKAAAHWYRQAAQQDNSRAQINLGFLYEQGKGVERDLAKALNWYRRASGMQNDELEFASSVETRAKELASAEVTRARAEASQLRSELGRLRGQLDRRRDDLNAAQRELDRLRRQLDSGRTGATPMSSGEIQQYERKLKRQQAEVDAQRRQITKLETSLQREKSELASSRQTSARLSADLSRKDKEITTLQTKLDKSEQRLTSTRSSNVKDEQKLRDLRSEIDRLKAEQAQASAASGDQTAEVERLKAELADRDRKLADQRRRVSDLESRAAQLDSTRSSAAERERELALVQQQLADAKTTLAKREKERAKLQDVTRRLTDSLQETLKSKETERTRMTDTNRRMGETLSLSLKEREQRIASLEKDVQQREIAHRKQQKRIRELEKEVAGYNRKLTRIEETRPAIDPDVVVAGPTIEILDPPISLTRGIPSVKLRSAESSRLVVGKVTAPGGLLSLTVNDRRQKVDATGVFKANVALKTRDTPVKMVAIDRRGQRTALEFLIIPQLRVAQRPDLYTKPAIQGPSMERLGQGLKFGDYYALIISNEKYRNFPPLETPVNDARRVERLLHDKYGFETVLLTNANRYEILSALNTLRERLNENDNLLIYYAGHGELDRINERGHWLPVDAERSNTANWVSNTDITDIINAMSVKHVMVVADSCYSGSMTRSSLARMDVGMSFKAKRRWLEIMSMARSRTVLTSGGLQPVLDRGEGNHSIFADAFLNALENNDTVLEGYSLYRTVSDRVQRAAARYGIDQTPQYAPIKHGGHEAGEFFFVPKGSS